MIYLIELRNQKNATDYNYKCWCLESFFGLNCENEFDLCENRNCKVNENKTAMCECFQYYSGTDCEIITDELSKINKVIRLSSIIGIIFLFSTYGLLITNDLLYLAYKPKNKT